MAAEAQLNIEVSATNQASKVLKDVDKDAGGLGKTLGEVGKIAGGFIAANVIAKGASALTGFIGDSISAASDLNEVMNKTNAVFGDSAAEIQTWAAGGAKDFGLSKRAALDAASGFGNMFDQLGIGSTQAGDMSQSIVELGADFASFHNADITDVLDAQSAAFRGEYDALQKFLPLINAASVQQKAMEMTGKTNAAALTQQEKALATYQLMLEGAGQAVGDFDKTSGDLANTTRQQQAAMENLQATIGTKLLPVQLAITQAKLAMVEVLVTQVIPVLEELYARHWPAISAAINDVVTFIQANWPTISAVIGFVADYVITRIQGMLQQFEGIIQIVSGVVAFVTAIFHGEWAQAWQAMQQIAEGVMNLLIGNLRAMFGNIPEMILALIPAAAGAAQSLAQSIYDGMINVLEALPGQVLSLLQQLPGIISGLIGEAQAAALSVARAIVDAIIGELEKLPGRLYDLGKQALDSFANGLKSYVPSLPSPNLPDLNPFASGTNFAPGGLALVGEKGPEIVNLPRGSQVFTNQESRGMMGVPAFANGTGGIGTINVYIQPRGSILSDKDLVRLLRNEIQNGALRDVIRSAAT